MIEKEEFILVRMMTGVGKIVSELSSVHLSAIFVDDPVKSKNKIVKGLKAAHDKIEALLNSEEVR